MPISPVPPNGKNQSSSFFRRYQTLTTPLTAYRLEYKTSMRVVTILSYVNT